MWISLIHWPIRTSRKHAQLGCSKTNGVDKNFIENVKTLWLHNGGQNPHLNYQMRWIFKFSIKPSCLTTWQRLKIEIIIWNCEDMIIEMNLQIFLTPLYFYLTAWLMYRRRQIQHKINQSGWKKNPLSFLWTWSSEACINVLT